jgi:2-polyprenyl-6-methoxyphenol hydroxylase-like FAD-dependent oxidoreductase
MGPQSGSCLESRAIERRAVGEIAICGGSVIGLATAMMLARDGHHVTILESDPTRPPDYPADAWDRWDRKGVAQFGQPHNLFSRFRQVADSELPGVTDALLEAGCTWVNPIDRLPPWITDTSSRPGDERFPFVTGRRPVMEAAIARMAESEREVVVHRGSVVAGVVVEEAGSRSVPHIGGVRLTDGSERRADLVIDATGRRTKLSEWLVAVGASAPLVESEDSGFVYYTRYYRGADQPVPIAPVLTPMGSISLLTLVSDNSTWSITVFGAASDTLLRGLRDPERFSAVIAACPMHAHWLEGEPITDIRTMAGILDRYRRYLVDGRPVATGVVAVGDAWACTNPSAGRGLSVGILQAQRLRSVIREGLDDPEALVRRYDAVTESEVSPFFRSQIASDRVRVAEMEAVRNGLEPPPPTPEARAVSRAVLYDPDVFRGVIELVTCLSHEGEVFSRPGFMDKVEACRDKEPFTIPGPDRDHLIALLAKK